MKVNTNSMVSATSTLAVALTDDLLSLTAKCSLPTSMELKVMQLLNIKL